jgi:penicillin amidase
LLTWQLSYTADEEIDFSELHDAVGQAFPATSTDPAMKARSMIGLDMMRFEPGAKDLVVPPPGASFHTASETFPKATHAIASPLIPHDALVAASSMRQAAKSIKWMLGRGDWSSNNWVIAPSKSTTGHSLVASDPHLGLPAPAVFHMIALHVISSDPTKVLDVAGMSFAGTPGVVLGFDKHVAWGATVAVFDVNDVYLDTIHDGKVTIGGADVAIVPISDQIDYGDGNPQPFTIETVPGHGVILPEVKDHRFVARDVSQVMSIRWTGMEPSGELEAFLGLNRAANVDEAKKAVEDHFEVGAQNFVIGDDSGNIAYTTHSFVPVRPAGALKWDAKTWSGQLPCLVLPGDGGFEWTGRVDNAQLPQAKNPSTHYIATANSDQYGLVFDNDPSNGPLYLGCMWDPGFRKARVDTRVEALDKLSPDDVASIQADVKSPLGTHLAKVFSAAIKRAIASKAGTTPAPDLDAAIKDARWDDARMQLVTQLLDGWADDDYFAESGVVESGFDQSDKHIKAAEATMAFEAAMIPLFKRVLDDEIQAMNKAHGAAIHWDKMVQWKGLIRIAEKPEPLATANASGESVLWDDMTTASVTESRDFDFVMSMLDGLDFVTKTLGTDSSKWLWGSLHTIRFETMVSGTGGQLSIPGDSDATFPRGYPRHGDEQVIDRSDFGLGGDGYTFSFNYGDGPAQRFVGDMDPAGPKARNALPGGNVWQPGNAHFDDEAQMWRHNVNAAVNFAATDVAGAAEERIDFTPQ